jgi:hypothetical protein
MSTLHSTQNIANAIFEATPAHINEINSLIKNKDLIITSLEGTHAPAQPKIEAVKEESEKPKYVRPSRAKAPKK